MFLQTRECRAKSISLAMGTLTSGSIVGRSEIANLVSLGVTDGSFSGVDIYNMVRRHAEDRVRTGIGV
jgi:hypothetical protein